MSIFSRIKSRFSVHSQKDIIKSSHIRDFIYLDIERIRSYVSQVYGGLTIEQTTRLERRNTVQGSMAATLPFKAGIDLSRYVLKSDEETKSLHDQIFNQFYGALEFTDSLRHITNIDQDNWDETSFIDGMFITVKAVITITDYKYLKHFAENFQKLSSTLSRITSATSNTKQQQSGLNMKEIQKIPTKEIAGVIEELYGDLVKIDFFPFRDDPEKILVCSAARDLFRLNLKDLLTSYGPTIDAGWNAVLQVNRGEYPKNKILVSNTGSELDMSIKQVVSAISGVLQTAQTVNFPAVSVIPIAIFRETALG